MDVETGGAVYRVDALATLKRIIPTLNQLSGKALERKLHNLCRSPNWRIGVDARLALQQMHPVN